MEKLHTSEEICEALVRHVETTGSEVFNKDFVKGGEVVCTVRCMIGENAAAFKEAVLEWLEQNEFSED